MSRVDGDDRAVDGHDLVLDGQPHGTGGHFCGLDDQRVRFCPRHQTTVAQVGPVGERLRDRFEAGCLGGSQQL